MTASVCAFTLWCEPLWMPGQKTMNSHPTADQLAAFDLGQLQAAEWRDVERHIAACTICCQKLENLPEDAIVRLVRESASRAAETIDQVAASTGAAAATSSRVPPELIDHPRYRIIEVLGAGGMGVVFKAEHRLMERTVALKVIASTLVENPAAVERFRQEVKTAARLAHPNIVTAYDAEQAGDIHFLVMQYVEGASLDKLLQQRGRLPAAEACALVRQAALGLQHAHEKGMVHRDIKPGNLLVQTRASGAPGGNPQAVAKIADFGLSRFVSEVAIETLTASGMLVGTPDYIAPEQALNPRTADIRADIYSLGCTLYHLLAGRPPFSGGTPFQKLICHREKPVPPLAASSPEIPGALIRVVERMLAKDPAQRFQTPAQVVQALAPFTLQSEPAPSAKPGQTRRRSRTPVVALGVVVGLGLLAGAAYLLMLNANSPVAQAPLPETKLIPGSSAAAPDSKTTVGSKGVPPTTAAAEPRKPGTREQLIAWLDANNAFGSGSPFVANEIKYIDAQLKKSSDFTMTLGGALVKSRRQTCLVIRAGQFFAFDKADEELGAAKVVGNQRYIVGLPADTSPRKFLPYLRLSDLKIERASSLSFSGSVAYQSDRELTGKHSLRLTTCFGSRRVTYCQRLDKPLKAGTLAFSQETQLGEIPPGQLFIFVELATWPEPVTVLSKAVGAFVIVPPAEAQK
jgi:serine/threonine protein kinase